MSRQVRRQQECQAAKEHRKKIRQKQRDLRECQKAQGLEVVSSHSIPNRKCDYADEQEETLERQDACVEQIRVLRIHLPTLLKKLGKIPDFRNPKKTKHKQTMILLYGMLSFVFQMASRREANRKMTRPVFESNLRKMFPELDELPHHDTLNRVLSKIEVDQIEQAQIELIKDLIRKKKFWRYLIEGRYPIAIDGTQKLARSERLSEHWLERNVGKADQKRTQYYVSVLEASFVFSNGMVIPLMSEFLDYEKGDTSKHKQDCEQRAFHRLAERLKRAFPRLPILMLLDGLYPNGPIMERINNYKWDYMIVLQDDSLNSVWEEYYGLESLTKENRLKRLWGRRRQKFRWVNNIEYAYGPNQRKRKIVHVVTCVESWEEIDRVSGAVVPKSSRHAWISNRALERGNIHERCNLGARHRWGIESEFLVEKHHGYQYEHCFSYDWNAMRGYHYLMRLGHLFNVLVQYSSALYEKVRQMGFRGFIDFVRETMAGPWFDWAYVHKRLSAPSQLRLE